MQEKIMGLGDALIGTGAAMFYTIIGVATLAGTLRMGPIDFGRTTYNSVIGDAPTLKRQLLDYNRKSIILSGNLRDPRDIDSTLANKLGVAIGENGRINPDSVSMKALWDQVEEQPRTGMDQFVWTNLDN